MRQQLIRRHTWIAVGLLAAAGCGEAGTETAGDDGTETTTTAAVAALPAFPYDSLPVEIRNVQTNMCLTWTALTNSNPARQATCNGTKSQMWFLIKSTATTYQLRPGNLGWRDLAVTGGSTADGAAIEVTATGAVPTYKAFGFESQMGGSYRIQTFASKRVEVQNGSTSGSAVIRQAPCIADNKQRWKLTPQYVNFSFVTKNPIPGAGGENLCMDVPNASQDNWAVVQQWWCTEGAAHQRWSLVPATTAGYYSIKSTNSGKCIDVPGGSTQAGVQVQQFDCHGGDNQLWSFTAQSDGRLMIKNKTSNLCLKVGGASTAVNGPVVQESCGGTAAMWHYTHVVRRHFELAQVSNDDGSNLGAATDAAVTVHMDKVKQVYGPWGVNLLFDPATDRLSPLHSTHMNTHLRDENPPDVATCWVGSALSARAKDCANAWASAFFPTKVVVFHLPANTGPGFAYADQSFIKSLPLGVGNACNNTVKNDVHWAHELGHFMGLQHLYPNDNDLLAETPVADGSSCTDPLNTTNPLTTNIMTLQYNNFHQISPSQARIVRQTAFARWY